MFARTFAQVATCLELRWMVFLLNLLFISASCVFALSNSWGVCAPGVGSWPSAPAEAVLEGRTNENLSGHYQGAGDAGGADSQAAFTRSLGDGTQPYTYWLLSDTIELFFYIVILHHNTGTSRQCRPRAAGGMNPVASVAGVREVSLEPSVGPRRIVCCGVIGAASVTCCGARGLCFGGGIPRHAGYGAAYIRAPSPTRLLQNSHTAPVCVRYACHSVAVDQVFLRLSRLGGLGRSSLSTSSCFSFEDDQTKAPSAGWFAFLLGCLRSGLLFQNCILVDVLLMTMSLTFITTTAKETAITVR